MSPTETLEEAARLQANTILPDELIPKLDSLREHLLKADPTGPLGPMVGSLITTLQDKSRKLNLAIATLETYAAHPDSGHAARECLDRLRGHVRITINGTKVYVDVKDSQVLSYGEVVRLATATEPEVQAVFSITYRHGPDENQQGILSKGGAVKIKDGMIFNAVITDNA